VEVWLGELEPSPSSIGHFDPYYLDLIYNITCEDIIMISVDVDEEDWLWETILLSWGWSVSFKTFVVGEPLMNLETSVR